MPRITRYGGAPVDQRDQPPFERYLGAVLGHLSDLSPEQRASIAAELRAHLDDAAADQGRAPDDPALQRSVIRALGSSRSVGRALARANRPPGVTLGERLLLGGGCLGVILHTLVLLVGFIGAFQFTDEDTAEFVLLVTPLLAPVLLLPTLLALYRLYRPAAPRLSRAMLGCGLAGLIPIVVVPGLGLLSWLGFFSEQALNTGLAPLLPVFGTLLLGNGIWLLLASYLGQKTERLPDELTLLGYGVGVTWLGFVIGILIFSSGLPLGRGFGLLAIGSLLVMICLQLLWSPWLGYWLLRQSIRPTSAARA